MLEQLSKHSLIDMKIKATGDTHIDYHHTTEDTGIAIGECLSKALGIDKVLRVMHIHIFPWMKRYQELRSIYQIDLI